MIKRVFCLLSFVFLFFSCSKTKVDFSKIKQSLSEKTSDVVTIVGEKSKDYANKTIGYVKETAVDSLKKIDVVTEFVYTQPELNVVDDSICEVHTFSYKKDLYLTINMLPNTRFIESAKELVKISEKNIPVEISVKLPKSFDVSSTGGLVSEVKKKDSNNTVFLFNINNTKNKLYSLILKISGRTDGEVFVTVTYRDDESDIDGICENIQQKILFKR